MYISPPVCCLLSTRYVPGPTPGAVLWAGCVSSLSPRPYISQLDTYISLYYTVDTNILSSGYTYIERSPGRSNVVIETNSHVIKSIHCACAILHVTVFVFTSDMARRLGRLLLPKVYRDSLVRLSVRLSSDQAYVPDKPPVEGEKNAISPPFRYCVMCVLYLCV